MILLKYSIINDTFTILLSSVTLLIYILYRTRNGHFQPFYTIIYRAH
nr:MAG TPA: hypothetical protein [Bacteriophage sp.]